MEKTIDREIEEFAVRLAGRDCVGVYCSVLLANHERQPIRFHGTLVTESINVKYGLLLETLEDVLEHIRALSAEPVKAAARIIINKHMTK